MIKLFEPLTLRSVTFRNRAWISPMCMYSAEEGMPQPWHMVHLGSRASGGAGCVMAEATAVEPEGRISPSDTGLWNDEQVDAWRPITAFIRSQGAVPAVQIAHAGRKASTREPWFEKRGGVPEDEGGWTPRSVGTEKFVRAHNKPHMLTIEEIHELREKWVASAKRALAAGFRFLEIHSAHGYLFHQFLSPISNKRTDEYGGSFENRTRFLLETTSAVRDAWREDLPLAVRLSTTDWVEGGWDVEQSIEVSKHLRERGVDLIDCSSGGATMDAEIPVGPGFQVPNAARIRKEAGIAVGAVGVITEATQAEEILQKGDADAIFIARASLDDPYWPVHAAVELGVEPLPLPKQYAWVKSSFGLYKTKS